MLSAIESQRLMRGDFGENLMFFANRSKLRKARNSKGLGNEFSHRFAQMGTDGLRFKTRIARIFTNGIRGRSCQFCAAFFIFNFTFLIDFTAPPVKCTGLHYPKFLTISQQKPGKRNFT